MSFNGFNLPQDKPKPKGKHVTRDHKWAKERSQAQDNNLSPMSIRCCKTNWGHIFMMYSVYFVITPFIVMEHSVKPIVCIVFN